jgi:putative long chain acyl-CoA synthase
VWYFDSGSNEFRRLTPATRAELTGSHRHTNA